VRGVAIGILLLASSLAFAPTAVAAGEAYLQKAQDTAAALWREVGQAAEDIRDGERGGASPPVQPVAPIGSEPVTQDGWFGVAGAGLAAAGLVGILLAGGTRFLRPEDALQSGVRGRIYEYLRARRGANLKQLTEDLDLSTTNAVWHLRKLEGTGLVRSRKFNGLKVYYLTEGGVEARDLTLSAAALANENARAIFDFVLENPRIHQREIARALSVNHGTVRWHLKKLCLAGLLSEVRAGRVSLYEPTTAGYAAAKALVRAPVLPAPPVQPLAA